MSTKLNKEDKITDEGKQQRMQLDQKSSIFNV
jgi:hypothetical protein